MRTTSRLFSIAVAAALSVPAIARAAEPPPPKFQVTVTGLVKRPLALGESELAAFPAVPVRVNDVRQDGSFHGVFAAQGVPLKTLLDLAGIQKEAGAFPRPLDLTIVVRGKDGKRVTVSWAEVFYRNPADAVLAFSAAPVKPMKDCAGCHDPSLYEPLLAPLARPVPLPKLVMARDFDSDRSVEGVVDIEVVDLKPDSGPWPAKKGERVSAQMAVTGAVKRPLVVKDLSSFPRTKLTANVVGDGKGFHGRHEYEGTPLVEVLARAGVEKDPRSVFVASGADGYRVTISYGELFLSPLGQRILVADRQDGAPLKKDGKFLIIFPDDLGADRMMKASVAVEAFTLAAKPRVFVIGLGPGDTDLVTREAVTYLAKVDAVVAPAELYKTFSSLLAGKPNLQDSMKLVHKEFYAKDHPEIPAAELDAKFAAARKEVAAKAREWLARGQSVAFLDWGDPLIFGSSRWVRTLFSEGEIETVPSISSLNVSNAVLGKDVTCNGALILAAPGRLRSDEAFVKVTADHGDTLAIFVGVRQFKDLVPVLRKHYKDTTPVAVVYNAGMSGRQRRVTGTLQDILGKTAKDESLGLIYVGPCLSAEIKDHH